MIERSVDITIPLLWGDQHFIKNKWGAINYIVGANGTGKSLLADQLKARFNTDGFQSRYLNAERLVGLEKKDISYFGGGSLKNGFNISEFQRYKLFAEEGGLSSSAIIILKERLDIRLKIEALLSDIFGKTIRLIEEGGFLKAKMQNIKAGEEYTLTENECHGLKELITLLTFLYDPAKNCLIFDEPELHLHPQFQSFFLEEIRKIAGNPKEDPTKKLFFIITHSPYFIDLKSIDDLKNILVCHANTVPTYVKDLDADDTYVLKKFIPRFNTHHKQFFFSPNPVFVEGYTDQQIISIIFEKTGINIGASGSCIIDVGGKDELGVFYKLCKSLKINCRIIADLDAIFRGRLRRVVCEDECSQNYVQEKGIGVNLSNEIGDLESHLSAIATRIIDEPTALSNLIELKTRLSSFTSDEEHSKRVATLLAIQRHDTEIRTVLDSVNIANLNLIIGRISQIHSAFKSCKVFIFPKGEIEHYYTQSKIDYLNISNKDVWFHTERDYLLNATSDDVKIDYKDLIGLLKEAVPTIKIDIKKHLKFEVFEWIHKVQTGIARGEINNSEDLFRNAKINYTLYNQILDLQSLIINENKSFECKVLIKETLLGGGLEVVFNQATNAHTFNL